jgi:uncharacterized repeat protein (TIGR03806 family)
MTRMRRARATDGGASAAARTVALGAALLLGVVAPGCPTEEPAPPDDASPWPTTLSAWGLFEGGAASQTPAAGVVPFRPHSILFSDYAAKYRFVRLPDGPRVTYSDEGVWDFPVGTVLVKTFAYPLDERHPEDGERLIETRLLWRREGGWEAMVYLWNDAQTDATRLVAGRSVPVAWVDARGASRETTYVVPNLNQCRSCHAGTGRLHPLGTRTRQLDFEIRYPDGSTRNQVEHWAALGMFDRAPPPAGSRAALLPDPLDATSGADVDARARSYLEANCAHCHREGGAASSSGLHLGWEITDPRRLGVCKTPAAAGRGACGLAYDVVPGAPERSILICRVSSLDPAIKMPEIPTTLVHDEGVALLHAWIEAMEPVDCAMRGR